MVQTPLRLLPDGGSAPTTHGPGPGAHQPTHGWCHVPTIRRRLRPPPRHQLGRGGEALRRRSTRPNLTDAAALHRPRARVRRMLRRGGRHRDRLGRSQQERGATRPHVGRRRRRGHARRGGQVRGVGSRDGTHPIGRMGREAQVLGRAPPHRAAMRRGD